MDDRFAGHRRTQRDMTGDLNLELTAAPDAPWRARKAVTARLGGRIPVPRLSALLTVVSELVTNSVKHGPGGPIHLAIAFLENGAVLGRVEDGGHGRVAVRENANPAKGGMGLKLVDAFTDRWGVEDGTTNVWFEVAPRRFEPQLR